MGRNFPPADETGAADPFIIARCQGKRTKSRTKFETLNPGFFETVEMVVSLPPIGNKDVIIITLILYSILNLE
jgi:Ca2+-dependent lipid-binding protein